MVRLRRSLTVLLVSAVGLAAFQSTPAEAAPSSVNRAATWIASQVSGGQLDDGFSPVGASADGLIALASADDPALKPTIDTLLATVRSGAADYVAGGGGPAAGKLAVVAAAYDLDPRSFGGVDLVAALEAGVAEDGSVGPYPSAFGSGLALVGFGRTGADAPAAVTTWLAGQQNDDGGFGYAAGQPSDADNTALAILGLLADDSPAARPVLDEAVAWAVGARKADGSWDGYVPVNSTCVLGSAVDAAGAGVASTRTFVTSRQLAGGAITDGEGPNLMATSQCAPLLGDVSYLDVEWAPAKASVTPSPTTVPPSQNPPAADDDTDASPSPTVTAAPTADDEADGGRGVPARTGADEDVPALPLALASVGLAVGVAALRRRA